MFEVKQTDLFSCNLIKNGKFFASLQWYDKRPPRIVLKEGTMVLQLDEIIEIVSILRRRIQRKEDS